MSLEKRNWREDVKVFRERMGGLTEEKKARTREQHTAQKSIRDALKDGAKTVPQLARITAMPSDRVLWYVMAMKRYGKIAETGQEGDYYLYSLRETQP